MRTSDLFSLKRTEHDLGAVTLVVANLLPLAGVLFLGWRAFDVVFLYWLENVIIGAVNVMKMLAYSPDNSGGEEAWLERFAERVGKPVESLAEHERAQAIAFGGASGFSKFFFVPFFTLHYGLFCLVHGVFVVVMLGGDGFLKARPGEMFEPELNALPGVGLLVVAAGLAVSHLVSFFRDYLGRGEHRRRSPVELMAEPYGRIVVLHVAIVFSGFLVVALGSPIWLLVLLVVGKTSYEWVRRPREPASLKPGVV